MLALVSFVITPLLSSLLRQVVSRASELSYKKQQAASKALDFANEKLTNIRTVQIFAQEDREAVEYGNLAREGYNLARKCAYFQGAVEGAGRLAVNVGTLSLLSIGGLLVILGRISLGSLLAFNVFNLFISVGLSSVAASLGDLGKALGALNRIAELTEHDSKDPVARDIYKLRETLASKKGGITEVPDEIVHPTASARRSSRQQGVSLEFKDVWFKYPSQKQWAISGLNLSIAPGKTLALVGHSGSGKTTLAALLMGLYEPQRGTIEVDRVTMTKDNILGFRSLFSAVLQRPHLFSGSIADNIRLGAPQATDRDVKRAANLAYASEFIESLPDSYNTILSERGNSLSGGQQQRIAIARALVCRPRALILDEPTSALDAEAERAIQATLREFDGCTKVIIAHRLSTVQRADKIAVLSHGKLVELGNHEELLAQNGTYARMVADAGLEGNFDESYESGSDDAEPDASMIIASETELSRHNDEKFLRGNGNGIEDEKENVFPSSMEAISNSKTTN